MWPFTPNKLGDVARVSADSCGLLLILAGSLWGITVGSWLLGNMGGVLGLLAGALWGFHVAEGCAYFLKPREDDEAEVFRKTQTTTFAQPEKAPLSSRRWPRLSRILSRKPMKSSPPDSYGSFTLEEVHHHLKTINSNLWRELRTGVLSGCFAGLHSVRLSPSDESLDWREANRRTVSALRRFETTTSHKERRASLIEALERIGQKLLLVQKAALRKAERLSLEEEREVQKYESELWRLSRLDCLSSSHKS